MSVSFGYNRNNRILYKRYKIKAIAATSTFEVVKHAMSAYHDFVECVGIKDGSYAILVFRWCSDGVPDGDTPHLLLVQHSIHTRPHAGRQIFGYTMLNLINVINTIISYQ